MCFLARNMIARALVVGVAVLLAPVCVWADAIVVSRAMTADVIAEIFIEEGSVRVHLEVGGEDLATLVRDGAPEDLRDVVVVATREGTRLPFEIVSVEQRTRTERDEVTGEPRPTTPEAPGEEVLFAVLETLLEGQPEVLLVGSGHLPGDRRPSVGFVVYHDGLAVNEFRYLGPEYLLELDWEDAWYSRFSARALLRRYAEPFSVFLYVEPYEVRVEVIARPRDLEHWVDLGIGGASTIPAEAQAEIRRKAGDFLAEHLDLRIDGEPVEPTLDRVHFLRRTLRSSTVIDPPEDIDTTPAVLGAIFVAPTNGLPKSASLTWELWKPRMRRVAAAAVDQAGPLPQWLTSDDRVLTWQNFLKNPQIPSLVSIEDPPPAWAGVLGVGARVCAVALVVLLGWMLLARYRGHAISWVSNLAAAFGLLVALGVLFVADRQALDDTRIGGVVADLLHNVYRAFDYRDEGAVYDVLAKSVDGELLERLYLETRRGLELESQGGARVKVKEVELRDVETEPAPDGDGVVARARWDVAGSVGHWGHVHQRRNRYDANLRLAPRDGAWKLIEVEILEEERVAAP